MAEGIDSAPYHKFRPHQGEHFPPAPLKERVNKINQRERDRQNLQKISLVDTHRRTGILGFFDKHRKKIAAVVLAGAISQTPVGQAAISTAVDTGASVGSGIVTGIDDLMNPTKHPDNLRDISEIVPEQILDGTVTIKRGAELRSELFFPDDAHSTGHHNLANFSLLGDGNEQAIKNPEIVRNNLDNTWSIVLPTKDGKALYLKYDLGDLSGNATYSEGAHLTPALQRTTPDGGREFYAARISSDNIGVRITPAPAPTTK
jgi:hypothetical protein